MNWVRTVYDCGIKVYRPTLLILFLISLAFYLFLATVTHTPFDPGGCIFPVIPVSFQCKWRCRVWIARLVIWLLGWAGIRLIALFLFMEAIQVCGWPRSFQSSVSLYGPDFPDFIVISLLYLHWNMPADTLENPGGWHYRLQNWTEFIAVADDLWGNFTY